MITWPRLLLSYVLASLFCLGVWYYQPVPIPRVVVTPYTAQYLEAQFRAAQQQKVIDRAVKVSAHIYRRYNCTDVWAKPTVLYALQHGVPVRIATAVVIVESSCNPNAYNRYSGATGLTQVMPKIHHVSRQALLDPNRNLDVGTRYLGYLIRVYGIEDGVANYFGVTEGSDKAYDYADHVLLVAGYRR